MKKRDQSQGIDLNFLCEEKKNAKSDRKIEYENYRLKVIIVNLRRMELELQLAHKISQ